MSWFSRLAGSVSKSIFSDSGENKFLPQAPTIMAADSKWYNSAQIQREDVLNRIVKDVRESTDLYSCINVYEIADTIVGNTYLGNYGTYLRELHKDLVEETRECAMELHYERHKNNMRIFFLITRLKIQLHSKLKHLRNKKAKMKYAAELVAINTKPTDTLVKEVEI